MNCTKGVQARMHYRLGMSELGAHIHQVALLARVCLPLPPPTHPPTHPPTPPAAELRTWELPWGSSNPPSRHPSQLFPTTPSPAAAELLTWELPWGGTNPWQVRAAAAAQQCRTACSACSPGAASTDLLLCHNVPRRGTESAFAYPGHTCWPCSQQLSPAAAAYVVTCGVYIILCAAGGDDRDGRRAAGGA